VGASHRHRGSVGIPEGSRIDGDGKLYPKVRHALKDVQHRHSACRLEPDRWTEMGASQ